AAGATGVRAPPPRAAVRATRAVARQGRLHGPLHPRRRAPRRRRLRPARPFQRVGARARAAARRGDRCLRDPRRPRRPRVHRFGRDRGRDPRVGAGAPPQQAADDRTGSGGGAQHVSAQRPRVAAAVRRSTL
ncbi:MAG: hypothetical protein AVDCRST_MAG67-129, partial [uncultured Solirubrobacteraceae bacterium]